MNKDLLKTAGVVVLIILCIIAAGIFVSSKKELARSREQQRDFTTLKNEYLSVKAGFDSIESRKSISSVKGIVQAVDELFLSVGLKHKIRSVKPLATKEMPDVAVEEAELQLEKININDAVNIFYKMENAPMGLIIRKAAMKTSFENPALLDVTMTLALIRPK